MGWSLLFAEVILKFKHVVVATSHLESMDSAELRKIQCSVANEVLNSSGLDNVFMGDFNYSLDWKYESKNLDMKIYRDLWKSLKSADDE